MNKRMNLILISILLIFAASNLFAQKNQVRFIKQHNKIFAKDKLEQTQTMLIEAMKNDSVKMELSAVQTLRELEQIYPNEPFNQFIEPLIGIVKDEEADIQLRILSAIALDELHSDKGDAVLFEAANNSTNESFRNLCTAISFQSYILSEKNSK